MTAAKKKIAFMTFGCRANQYDTAAMGHVMKDGYEVVPDDAGADVFVVNSCAITGEAENEARRYLARMKRKNPNALTVVTGCSAEASHEGLAAVADLVVGNSRKSELPDLLRAAVGGEAASDSATKKWTRKDDIFFAGGVELDGHARSFLKIQDGCSQFCSYCIVPFTRGLNRSIEPSRILASLYDLKERGIEEAVLTGIHLGTYGRDLTPAIDLDDLLELIAKRSPVRRIRLSSIDPEEITDRTIELLSGSEVFCDHLHLPLQSGDDSILRRMRRRYTAADFLTLTEKLAKRIPGICIGTDAIVGFPGESDDDYGRTHALLEAAPVHYFHVFPYSTRSGTKAALFRDQVEGPVKKARVKSLRALSDLKKSVYYSSFKGASFEVIVEARNKGLFGMSRNYMPIAMPETSRVLPGQKARVRVTDVQGADVFGEWLPDGAPLLESYEV